MWIVPCLLLLFSIIGYVIRNSVKQKQRISSLSAKCAAKKLLYVFVEGELGLWQNAVENVSQLLDNAECPTRLAVHVLEPVASIRDEDVLLKELERACKLAPNYNTFFKESVFIHKIHRLKLDETNAIIHFLSSLKRTIEDDDRVLWIPPSARLKRNWDEVVRKDAGDIVVWPFPEPPKLDIERYFYTEPLPEASFFRLTNDFQYEPFSMARPGMTRSLGISMRHAFATSRKQIEMLSGCKTDMCIAYKSRKLEIMNGSEALGFCTRASSNRKANIDAIQKDADFQNNQGFDGEEVFGRALLGMTVNYSLQEILVKWGSEVAFERERDILRYG